MKLIRGLNSIKPAHRGCVLTIGNFDGLHLGHQALLAELNRLARKHRSPSCLMSFEPLPHEYFSHASGSHHTARLMNTREKLDAFAALGASLTPDYLLLVHFNQAFAAMSADEFIQRVLCDELAIRAVVVGDDFHFGRARDGNFERLREAGAARGFEVYALDTHVVDAARVSSTRIRDALQQDRLADAARMLGHDYQICGRVVHGEKRGRTLGFPTANIHLKRSASPIHGVYSVTMHTARYGALPAIANVGQRPTVDGTRIQLEVHVFDFANDLYGQSVCISFQHKIRDEIKFESLDALKRQIEIDCETALTQLRMKSEK
jgi:riboflavin kinase / FMN adenylyltransferase